MVGPLGLGLSGYLRLLSTHAGSSSNPTNATLYISGELESMSGAIPSQDRVFHKMHAW